LFIVAIVFDSTWNQPTHADVFRKLWPNLLRETCLKSSDAHLVSEFNFSWSLYMSVWVRRYDPPVHRHRVITSKYHTLKKTV